MPSQIALLARFCAGPFLDGEGRFAAQRVRGELARRSGRVPALGRRILWTRFGEGRPVWVRDPEYDSGDHITCSTLPPGTDLLGWSADAVVRPLDRGRPLWRAEIVDGLSEGRFALLVVLHHAVADGLAGVAIATALFDPGPATPAAAPPVGPVASKPTHRALVADHLGSLPTSLHSAARRLPHVPTAVRRGVVVLRDLAPDLHVPAPATSLPSRDGPSRRLAAVRIPLDKLRAAAHDHRATINDVLLAG